ncbi:MAG: uroporphyrinogen decarboxylase family protein [Planctomycetaceae bacterium]|nr:uroporphyrinogen decarboxylase family protein [Planctomycetaceae bacterium]
MNGFERITTALRHETTDSLPFMPITMMFAADTLGVPYGKYATDFNVLADAQLATARKFGFDYVSTISDPGREAADLGASVHFFDDAPPAIDENNALLADRAVLKTLKPLAPLKSGSRCLDRVNGVKKLAENVKGELFIEGWVEGPCAEGADLRGINNLMTDFFDAPEFIRELFAFNVENALRFAEEQIKAGADIIGVGDAAASLVGPKIYREFVFPFEKQLVDGIHQLGGRVRLHICGNISRSLKEVGQLGCDFVDLDSMVSIEKARLEMPPEQVIAGNIDPVKVLRNGTPDEIYAAVAECHRQAGNNFIIGAGCEVPRDTPPKNIEAMRRYAASV